MSDTLKVCGLTIERGTKLRTYLPVPDTNVKIPLTIINGDQDGPTLLITAGIHGGEYPGIAAAMELGRDIEPEHVAGCLIMMHPVNIQGFWARREMIVPEDGKNLNRVFPGDPMGTLADKTAYLISNNFFSIADFYVDMHSGDIHESLHPYVYYPGQPTPEVERNPVPWHAYSIWNIWYVRLQPAVPITTPPAPDFLLSLSNAAVPVSACTRISKPTRMISAISCAS